MGKIFAVFALTLLVPISALAAPTINITVQGGGPNDFIVASEGANAPYGDMTPKGISGVSFIGIDQNNPGETVNVTVNVEMHINKDKIGRPYTEKDPNSDCAGATLPMTDDWVKSHELQHVADMQDRVREAIQAVINSAQPVTVNTNGGGQTTIMTYNANAGVQGAGPQQAAPTAPGWQNQFQKNIQDMLNNMVQQEEREYGLAEKGQAFPKGGLEDKARVKSCDDYLDGLLQSAQQHLSASRDAMLQAKSAANDAKAAAGRALAAAKACDRAAYEKAAKEFENARKLAEAGKTVSRNQLQQALQAISSLRGILNGSKRVGGLSPHGMQMLTEVQAVLTAAQDWAGKMPDEAKQVDDALKNAATTMQEAKVALEKCTEKKKDGDVPGGE